MKKEEPRFKKGDKVRLICDYANLHKGDIVTIDQDWSLCPFVIGEDGKRYVVSDSSCELIKNPNDSESKFKVGARVKSTYEGDSSDRYGTIIGKSKKTHTIVWKIDWDDGNVSGSSEDGKSTYAESNLELVNEKIKPDVEKFKVGDFVRYYSKYAEDYIYGTITRIDDKYGKWCIWSHWGRKNQEYESYMLDTSVELVERGHVVNEDTITEHVGKFKKQDYFVPESDWWGIYYKKMLESRPIFVGADCGEERSKPKKSIMSQVTRFVKNLALSADDKLLRKYDLQNECGEVTEEGKGAILEKFFNSPENKAYLVSIAEGLEKERKEDK